MICMHNNYFHQLLNYLDKGKSELNRIKQLDILIVDFYFINQICMEINRPSSYKTEQERKQLIEKYKQQPFDKPKRSLCRFYLRGICLFAKQQCKYSHGIDDLIYEKQQQPLKPKAFYMDVKSQFNQPPIFKQSFVYTNLYESQTKYSLQEIKQFSDIRDLVRKDFQRKEFTKFIRLLEKEYEGEELTEDFIERQYYRLGFNKLMTKIKYGFLLDFLVNLPESQYIKTNFKKKAYIVKKASDKQTDEYYTKQFIRYFKENQFDSVKQNELKSWLYNQHTRKGVPFISVLLKNNKLELKAYLELLTHDSEELAQLMGKQSLESLTDRQLLKKKAIQLIEKSANLVQLSQITQTISKQMKHNNSNITNILKQILLNNGVKIYHLPTFTFIYDSQKEVPTKVCKCTFKDYQQFTEEVQQHQLEVDVFIIDNEDKYRKCLYSILKSEVLGVDIEGKLRKNGNIQIIQLNNTKHTYLFDFYQIIQDKNELLLSKIKTLLKHLMLNPKILKVFHDSRHDALALHQHLQTCIINILDTSAVDIFLNQRQILESTKLFTPAAVTQLTAYKTPGINQLLKKYEAPHGINPYKEQFHKLMSKNQKQLFLIRPINKEYLEYCVKDVLDLPYLSRVMSEKVANTNLIQHLSQTFVENGYLATL